MFSISKTGSGFYCIECSATEDGPKVIKSKFIKSIQNINDTNVLKNILKSFKPTLKQESKSLSVTLEENNFLFSEVKIDSKIGSEQFISWYEKNILNKDFVKFYDLYYFPLYNKNFLVISLEKEYKNKLLSNCKDLGYDLINLSIGIFSTAVLVKQLYKKNDFILWKIDKNNYHYLLHINDGKIKTFSKMKKSNKNIKKIFLIGDNNEEFQNILTSILIEKKEFQGKNKIYIYRINNSLRWINEIEKAGMKKNNFIDISTLFELTTHKSFKNRIKYVENGIAFRGLDV